MLVNCFNYYKIYRRCADLKELKIKKILIVSYLVNYRTQVNCMDRTLRNDYSSTDSVSLSIARVFGCCCIWQVVYLWLIT